MTLYKDGKKVSSISSLAAIVIRRGIPIPPRAQVNEDIYATARKMLIGDCIDLPYSRKPVARNLGRATGFKFTQRKVGDFLRVWRVE